MLGRLLSDLNLTFKIASLHASIYLLAILWFWGSFLEFAYRSTNSSSLPINPNHPIWWNNPRTCLSFHINIDKSHLTPLFIVSGEILDVGGGGWFFSSFLRFLFLPPPTSNQPNQSTKIWSFHKLTIGHSWYQIRSNFGLRSPGGWGDDL